MEQSKKILRKVTDAGLWYIADGLKIERFKAMQNKDRHLSFAAI